MVFWKWFQSEQRVLEALRQQQNGYDVCPQSLQPPANTEEEPVQHTGLMLVKDAPYAEDHGFILSSNIHRKKS